jgi:hypothetical protein
VQGYAPQPSNSLLVPDIGWGGGNPSWTAELWPAAAARSTLHAMCNLYSELADQASMRALFRVDVDRTGNLPPQPGVYPDYAAPIVRNSAAGRELAMARWGMPTPLKFLEGKKTDPGVTNIRWTHLSAYPRDLPRRRR